MGGERVCVREHSVPGKDNASRIRSNNDWVHAHKDTETDTQSLDLSVNARSVRTSKSKTGGQRSD